MVGQGHIESQSKFIVKGYLSFIYGGTTVNINYNENLTDLYHKCLTACNESCMYVCMYIVLYH